MKLITECVFILCTTLCLTGCGEKMPEGMPKLYPVSLTITQEGKPLPGASISLRLENGETPRYNSGAVTDENGRATLTTHGKYLGVPEGKYIILVSKDAVVKTGPWDKVPQEEDAARKFVQANSSKLKTSYFSVVNKKYKSEKTSDLKLAVETKKLDASFEVGPAVKDLIDNGG